MIGRKRRAKAEDNLKLEQHDEEQQAKDYPYIVPPHVTDELNPLRRDPIKLPSLPTVAHNYTFWADLIFKPKSREEGMLLMVEGTSRWCWCHPFHHKDAVTIAAGIVEKFINLIDERITCLVTDAGTEWNGIPPLTEKYGFVWRRKNVTHSQGMVLWHD